MTSTTESTFSIPASYGGSTRKIGKMMLIVKLRKRLLKIIFSLQKPQFMYPLYVTPFIWKANLILPGNNVGMLASSGKMNSVKDLTRGIFIYFHRSHSLEPE